MDRKERVEKATQERRGKGIEFLLDGVEKKKKKNPPLLGVVVVAGRTKKENPLFPTGSVKRRGKGKGLCPSRRSER